MDNAVTLKTTDFSIHDVSRFPLVLASAETPPGYAARWAAELQALIAHGRPFVVVLAHARAEESHEDRKQRGIWLKHNKQALAALCKAVISVEPDAVRRAALLAQSMLAEKAFGVPMRTVCTVEQAFAEGSRLLGV